MAQRRKKRFLKKEYPQCRYTQRELANILGLSQGHIAHILDGSRTPSLPVALKMSELLNVPIDTFNRGENASN